MLVQTSCQTVRLHQSEQARMEKRVFKEKGILISEDPPMIKKYYNYMAHTNNPIAWRVEFGRYPHAPWYSGWLFALTRRQR
jgi:hypothetical protein